MARNFAELDHLLLPDRIQAESPDMVPQYAVAHSFVKLTPQRRPDIADCLVGRHAVEHHRPELGDPTQEVFVAGFLETAHHRGAARPVGLEQILDPIVARPGSKAIDGDQASGGMVPDARS